MADPKDGAVIDASADKDVAALEKRVRQLFRANATLKKMLENTRRIVQKRMEDPDVQMSKSQADKYIQHSVSQLQKNERDIQEIQRQIKEKIKGKLDVASILNMELYDFAPGEDTPLGLVGTVGTYDKKSNSYLEFNDLRPEMSAELSIAEMINFLSLPRADMQYVIRKYLHKSPVPTTKRDYVALQTKRDGSEFDPDNPPIMDFVSLEESVEYRRDPNNEHAQMLLAKLHKLYIRATEKMRQTLAKALPQRVSKLTFHQALFIVLGHNLDFVNSNVFKAFAMQKLFGKDRIDIHIGVLRHKVKPNLLPAQRVVLLQFYDTLVWDTAKDALPRLLAAGDADKMRAINYALRFALSEGIFNALTIDKHLDGKLAIYDIESEAFIDIKSKDEILKIEGFENILESAWPQKFKALTKIVKVPADRNRFEEMQLPLIFQDRKVAPFRSPEYNFKFVPYANYHTLRITNQEEANLNKLTLQVDNIENKISDPEISPHTKQKYLSLLEQTKAGIDTLTRTRVGDIFRPGDRQKLRRSDIILGILEREYQNYRNTIDLYLKQIADPSRKDNLPPLLRQLDLQKLATLSNDELDTAVLLLVWLDQDLLDALTCDTLKAFAIKNLMGADRITSPTQLQLGSLLIRAADQEEEERWFPLAGKLDGTVKLS